MKHLKDFELEGDHQWSWSHRWFKNTKEDLFDAVICDAELQEIRFRLNTTAKGNLVVKADGVFKGSGEWLSFCTLEFVRK